jgi:ankyrin repeat protein
MPDHPIFSDIDHGNLEEVKRRVLAEPAVLEERESWNRMTPLMYAIFKRKPAIALWLLEQDRGQHSLEAVTYTGCTALHYVCRNCLLSVVQALVKAGANPVALDYGGWTPLKRAAFNTHTDIVAFLLRLPAVQATIDTINQDRCTALSLASYLGHHAIVQLLLAAGADPTIPDGPDSPLHQASNEGHTDVAALLRRAIAEPDRARCLHKARSLLDAAAIIAKARKNAHDKGLSPAEQQHKAIAAAPAYLQGRVERGEPLPVAELTPPQHHQQQQQQQQQQHYSVERLQATAAFVVGLGGGEEDQGLSDDVYVELLGYMLPAWADKGP